MKKIKLLAIDQGQYLGGAERFFAELLTRMSEQFEVNLVTGDNEAYRKLYDLRKPIFHSLNIPRLKGMSIKTYLAYRKTRKNLEKKILLIEPDIIVSNTVRSHLLVSSLAKKYSIPLVWMLHDMTFPKSLLQFFLRYPRMIITCSRYIQDFYRLPEMKEWSEVELIYPFGINEQKILNLQLSEKKNIIGMVGKFIPWKGQDIFIKSASRIAAEKPEYRFIIIGSAYEGNKESEDFLVRCQEMITSSGAEERFQIIPSVTDLYEEIASWQILVHCSYKPEPLGRVILEGMAAGCIVIGSDLGGPKEIIEDHRTGLLVPPENDDIYHALHQLIDNSDIRDRIANTAQQWVKREFRWNNVLGQFESDLRQAMRA